MTKFTITGSRPYRATITNTKSVAEAAKHAHKDGVRHIVVYDEQNHTEHEVYAFCFGCGEPIWTDDDNRMYLDRDGETIHKMCPKP
jgi:hypothetical protein